MLALARLFAALLVLCATAASAMACAGGGAALTTLTTSLSGESKSGETITVLEGAGIKDQATLSGENAGTATGTIKYAVYSDKECKKLVAEAGEGKVEGKSIPASSEQKLTGGAVYYWQAVYSGDAKNSGSASPCGKEVATVQASTTLTTSLSGESKSGETITVLEGSGIKDQTTLSGTNVASATGSVEYFVYSDKECKKLVAEAGKGKVEGEKAAASGEQKLTGGAAYYWKAVYSGDSLHQGSTSTCGKEIASVMATTSLKTSLTGGGKEGEAITVVEGSGVKDQATLSGTNVASATGSVKYFVYSDKECKKLVAEAGKVTVTGGSVPVSEEEKPKAGAVYYWQAEYGGDSLHEPSSSPCGKEVLTVKAKTSLTTSLLGGGVEGAKITVGEGVIVADTATLSGTSAASATGSVKYFVYSDKECKKLVAEAGEVEVEGGEAALSDEEEMEKGAYYWEAVYSGDALHEGSSSSCGSEVVTVLAETSLTTTLSGEGEEEEEIEVAEGAAVSDAATLSGSKAATATGTVKYAVYADDECKKLVAKAGEVEVEGEEVPASSKQMLEPGIYYWQAEYSGDGANLPSTSVCGAEIVEVVPEITTTLSGGELSGAQIEVPVGTAISDEAMLHGEHAAEATGTVKYAVYADEECEELVAEAGSVLVEGESVLSSSKQMLEPGIYYWQAEYSGDGKNPPATSECGAEMSVVVTPTSLTTTLSGGSKEGETIEVEEGAAVSDKASLSGANASTAEGSVEYSVYSDSECTQLAGIGGAGEVSEGSALASAAKTLPVGTYYWQAEYSGDGLNAPSTSACGAEIEVVTAPITTVLSGGESSGTEIEAEEGTAVSDAATLHGEHAAEATGNVKYFVYSDGECKKLAAEAGEVKVEGAKVPASSKQMLEPGTYYWQAKYSGDGKNPAATSACGVEKAVVVDPAAIKYAALGDSFSAGEGIGIGTYYARADQWIPFFHPNQCHRNKESWPALVAETIYNAAAVAENTIFEQEPPRFIFRACSGARLDNIAKDPPVATSGQADEDIVGPPETWLATPSQSLWLLRPAGTLPAPVAANPTIRLVTLTIGGNDAGFAAVAATCITPADTLGNCLTAVATNEAAGTAAIEAKLPVVLKNIRASAPSAAILVPLYPRLINVVNGQNIRVGTGRLGNFPIPLTIDNTARPDANTIPAPPAGMGTMTAARAIQRFIGKVNLAIEEAVTATAAEGVPVKVVKTTADAFTVGGNDHRLGGNAAAWVNGAFQHEPQTRESFHPNRCGYIALARLVLQARNSGPGPALCP